MYDNSEGVDRILKMYFYLALFYFNQSMTDNETEFLSLNLPVNTKKYT